MAKQGTPKQEPEDEAPRQITNEEQENAELSPETGNEPKNRRSKPTGVSMNGNGLGKIAGVALVVSVLVYGLGMYSNLYATQKGFAAYRDNIATDIGTMKTSLAKSVTDLSSDVTTRLNNMSAMFDSKLQNYAPKSASDDAANALKKANDAVSTAQSASSGLAGLGGNISSLQAKLTTDEATIATQASTIAILQTRIDTITSQLAAHVGGITINGTVNTNAPTAVCSIIDEGSVNNTVDTIASFKLVVTNPTATDMSDVLVQLNLDDITGWGSTVTANYTIVADGPSDWYIKNSSRNYVSVWNRRDGTTLKAGKHWTVYFDLVMVGTNDGYVDSCQAGIRDWN